MTRKLGEILIDDGKITEAQLQKALKAQLIFGGHLGTSLIELGYINEEILGTALSNSFNVPFATEEILQSVPYAVTRAIPAKLVEKYRVVPIKLDGKILQLAMLDPKNLMALDEISFVTGYRIEPWVSPEIRIFQVLEKYYSIPRSQRYITLARELSKRGGSPEKPGQPDNGAEAGAQAQAAMAAASKGAGGGERGTASGRHTPDHWEKYGYGKSWREYADEMERDGAGAPATATVIPPVAPRPAGPNPAAGPGDHLSQAVKRLQACTSPEEIADVVLDVASKHFKRAAFFIVKGDHAVGWSGTGNGFSLERIKGVSIPLVRESLFSLVDDSRTHFLGAPPAFPTIRRFYQDLSVPMPRAAFIVPIRIRDKTSSLLYGDGGSDSGLGGLDSSLFIQLAARAALAMQMIIFRNKIVSG